jgi:fructose-bisphosphate aldolase class I
VPILEPEIDITSTEKVQAEELLKRGIAERLPSVHDGRQVMLKLSIPTNNDFYVELIEHSKVLRVVALSGGYSRHQVPSNGWRDSAVFATWFAPSVGGLVVTRLVMCRGRRMRCVLPPSCVGGSPR